MSSIELQDFDQPLPNELGVSVIMEKRPSSHPWQDYIFQAVGVVSGEAAEGQDVTRIYAHNGIERYLFHGLSLCLHVDECESYYHNLMSPQPGCFIVAEQQDDPDVMPRPYLVSLSFDEVHSYLEGDEQVYAVEIPPELYKLSEA